MLDVARRKPNGGRVDWVEVSAEDFRSPKMFDLIIMTGNTFQVFPEEERVRAVFTTVAAHLAHEGVFVFESRNPAIDWTSRWDDKEALLTLDGQSVRQHRRVIECQADRIEFDTSYTIDGTTLVSKSVLAFWDKHKIERLLGECGLTVQAVLGDWDGSPFSDEASEEMIFFVKRQR